MNYLTCLAIDAFPTQRGRAVEAKASIRAHGAMPAGGLPAVRALGPRGGRSI